MEIEPAAASITSETESIQKLAVVETETCPEAKLVNGNCSSNGEVDHVPDSLEGSVEIRKNSLSEKEQNGTAENGEDRDRSRSSSPEIIHIKTIAAPPKQHRPQKTEEELKRLFEIEYLEKVLFKIHALLTDSKEFKPETETKTRSEDSQSETQNGEEVLSTSAENGASANPEENEKTSNNKSEIVSQSAESSTSDEPEAKRVKFSLNDETKSEISKVSNEDGDDDDEITTVRTIQASVVPGFSAELESKFCDLWDLSSQAQVAQFMFEKSCYEPLKDIFLKTSASFREIALGILSNLSSIRDVCEKCYNDSELLENLYSFFEPGAPKPDIQNQALKLFSFCLQHDDEKWSKLLNEKKIIPKSFEFLSTEKPYIIEKIMENMGYIFDVSENLSFTISESSDFNLVDVICKALKCYGINSKEERSVETIGNLLAILSYLESNPETASKIHRKSEAIFDIIQHILSCIDEKQFTYSYTSCIERSLKLSLKLLSLLETAEEKLDYFKKYSEFNMCWIEFLEFFEQEVEENEYSAMDQFSLQNIYLALTECYNISKFFEKLKEDVGDAKFFEGVADDLREMLSSTFETYSSKMTGARSDNEESDNDIVEITSTETKSQVSTKSQVEIENKKTEEKLVAIREGEKEKSEPKSEVTADNSNEEDLQNVSGDRNTSETGKDNPQLPVSDPKDELDQNVGSEVTHANHSSEVQSPQPGTEGNSEESKEGKLSESGKAKDNENSSEILQEAKEADPEVDQDESIPDLSDTDL